MKNIDLTTFLIDLAKIGFIELVRYFFRRHYPLAQATRHQLCTDPHCRICTNTHSCGN